MRIPLSALSEVLEAFFLYLMALPAGHEATRAVRPRSLDRQSCILGRRATDRVSTIRREVLFLSATAERVVRLE